MKGGSLELPPGVRISEVATLHVFGPLRGLFRGVLAVDNNGCLMRREISRDYDVGFGVFAWPAA